MSALTEKIIIKKISNLIVPDKETGKNKNFFIILDEKDNYFQYECVQDDDGFLDYTTQKMAFSQPGDKFRVLTMKKRTPKGWIFKIIKIVEEEKTEDNIDNLLNF